MITAMIFLLSKNIKNMKNLIILALDEAYKRSKKDAPEIKYDVTKSGSISGMTVSQLLSFIKENNINPEAVVSVDTESSDVFISVRLNLYNNIPLTEQEREYAVRGNFDRYAAMGAVRIMLENNGYKSKYVDRDKLMMYKTMSLYDMYMAKEFDFLVNYFSLFFDEE